MSLATVTAGLVPATPRRLAVLLAALHTDTSPFIGPISHGRWGGQPANPPPPPVWARPDVAVLIAYRGIEDGQLATPATPACCKSSARPRIPSPRPGRQAARRSGDLRRFSTKQHFAAHTDTAPLEASSGKVVRHRLSRAGDRKLNHALHLMAIVQIRHPPPGRPTTGASAPRASPPRRRCAD